MRVYPQDADQVQPGGLSNRSLEPGQTPATVGTKVRRRIVELGIAAAITVQ